MKFNINLEPCAKFKLIKRNKVLEINGESSEFFNLVLGSGISQMGVDNWATHCHVGSGNSEPIPAQTSLDAQTAITNTVTGGWTHGVNTVDPDSMFYWVKGVFRFNEGVAAGNLSEVAIGWGSGIWNRALIRDINNTPTTITVLSDEVLDVYVEVRMYVPSSVSGSFNLVDKNNNLISAHSYTGKPKMVSTGAILGKIGLFRYSHAAFNVYSGGLPPSLTTDPTGSLTTGSETTSLTYSYGKCSGFARLGLDNANGSHRTIGLPIKGFACTAENPLLYFFEITPPIPKSASHKMEYELDISWGARIDS